MKKAFTLAELMIVLTVIGVLSAILMPIAIQSTPDENILRFKKGNATIGTVIQELVNSTQYYKDGDLGMKYDGTLVTDKTYFCKTFADVVSTKSVNCSSFSVTTAIHGDLQIDPELAQAWFITPAAAAIYVDERCDEYAKRVGAEIITTDGITYYQAAPNITFGLTYKQYTDQVSPGTGPCQTASTMYTNCSKRQFPGPHDTAPRYTDKNGNDPYYKIFCMDIDGRPDSAYAGNCVNECPFGYGIRADGKIFYGARAQEWAKKAIQKTN